MYESEVCTINRYIREVRRGDIYYADLSPVVGSEQGGIRPVLILQNNVGNLHSPTVIACAITAQPGKAPLPTHVHIGRYGRLSKSSIALLEQIRTIDKERLQDKAGYLTPKQMEQIDTALQISVGLAPAFL